MGEACDPCSLAGDSPVVVMTAGGPTSVPKWRNELRKRRQSAPGHHLSRRLDHRRNPVPHRCAEGAVTSATARSGSTAPRPGGTATTFACCIRIRRSSRQGECRTRLGASLRICALDWLDSSSSSCCLPSSCSEEQASRFSGPAQVSTSGRERAEGVTLSKRTLVGITGRRRW